MTYDHGLARVYDLLYEGTGKDYGADAVAITALIRDRHPHAASLLDVGCGTGLHLAAFATMFTQADGADLSADMLAVAAARLPATVTLTQADMRTLHLPGRYDAVTVLFSAIGYMRGEPELRQAFTSLATHLTPGGVLIADPWFTPSQWRPGTIRETRYEDEQRTLIRLAHSHSTGNTSTMDMHYLDAHTGTGITHWTDQHVMSLFTHAEYEHALTAAGLTGIEWVPGPGHVRDRLVAVKPGGTA